MRFKNIKRSISWLLCMTVIAAVAFTTAGCGVSVEDVEQPSTESQGVVVLEENILGEGQTEFVFTVIDKDGNETNFEIYTDKETVGDALLELDLIDGEQGEFGLYVKVVNGITADYDVDKAYWAFYINGEYALTGVDLTNIEKGATYAFKVEK